MNTEPMSMDELTIAVRSLQNEMASVRERLYLLEHPTRVETVAFGPPEMSPETFMDKIERAKEARQAMQQRALKAQP